MYEDYKTHDIAIYGGFLKNDQELLECTSGGIATALARQMIRQGGCVAGVSYSDDFREAKYELVKDEKGLERFKGSKYVEVNKKNIYKDVKVLLEEGKGVLFFGLPCTVAAVKTFLKKEYDNLITCELICHGPVKTKVHTEYIDYLEKRFNSKIKDFSVRKKKGTWLPPYLYAEFVNGKVFEKEFYKTEYGCAFKIMGKKACYCCKFKGNNRIGDIMLGDFLGAAEQDIFWNHKGISVIFAHTEKGKDFLGTLEEVELFETDFEKAVSNNLMVIQSREKSPEKEYFEKMFEKNGLIYAAHRSKYFKKEVMHSATGHIPKVFRSFLKRVYNIKK